MTVPPETRRGGIRRLRRGLWVLVFVLVAFELVYLVAGNAFLRSEWGRQQINRRPEKFTLTWDGASTWWPGRVQFSGVVAEGHARRVDWSLTADRALLVMDLMPLVRKIFRTDALYAEGVTFASQRLEKPRDPIAPGRSSENPKAKKPWTLQFDDVDLAGVRSIHFNDLEILPDGEEGDEGSVVGGLVIALRRTVEVKKTTLTWNGARLNLRGEPWVRSLDLTSQLAFAPWNPREHRGLQSLAYLSGELGAKGRIGLPGGEPSKRWSIDGEGDLRLRAVAEDGILTSESRASVGLEGFDLHLPKGQLTAAVEVVAGVEGELLVAGLQARDLAFRREGADRPLVTSRQARISVGSEDRSLATGLQAMVNRLRAMRKGPEGGAAARVASIDAQGVKLQRAGRLEGELAQLAGRLDLNALADRRVALDRVRGRGGRVAWLAKDGREGARERPAGPWVYEVTDVELVEVPKVSFGAFDLEPISRFGARSVRFAPGREIELGGAFVQEENGRLTAAGRPVASRLLLDGTLDFGPFDLGSGGREAIARLTTRAKLSGQVTSLGFFRYAFEAAPWLALDGAGDLDADLRIDSGRLAVGSRLRVDASPVEADFLDYRVVGDAAVSAIVASDSRGPRADLFVNLEDFKMAGLNDPDRPYVEGRGFHLTATTADLDLRKPFEDLEAVVDLPNSSVPDLTVYNAYLPKRANVGIDSGSGQIQAYFELSAADDSGWGRVDVRSSEVGVHFLDQELTGALHLKTRLETTQLEERSFALDDSRLELTDVELVSPGQQVAEADWWARLELNEGDMSWRKPLTLDSQATLSMKDTGFLLSVFSERKRWLHWFQRLLDFEDVVGDGRVVLEPGSLRLDPVLISAEKLEIRTRLRFAEGSKHGYLYVRSHGLAAGLELDGSKRDFRLIRPKQWYESRPSFP
ncbi:MAG: hypothetical protein AAF481_13265 [Acidobacteriota bacterium]